MWSGIGKLLGSLFKSLIGGLFGWLKQRKLKREASRGRAAKEFLRSEDEAKKEEDKQREAQDKVEKDGVTLDEDDLFNTNGDR